MVKSSYTNILITGAGGILAQKLIDKFLINGNYNIVSSTRNVNSLLNKQNGIKYVNNTDLITTDILKNTDIIINCAFPRSQDTIALYEAMHFFELLVLKAIDLKVKGIINISSQSVYGSYREIPSRETDNLKPEDIYAFAKIACESIGWALTKESDTKHTNIRLASLIGKEYPQRAINKMVINADKAGKIEIQNDKNVLGYMDIDDAAEGLYAFVNNSDIDYWKTVYNLGQNSANEITMAEYAKIIQKQFDNNNKKLEIILNSKDKADKLCLMNSNWFYEISQWKPKKKISDFIEKLVNSLGGGDLAESYLLGCLANIILIIIHYLEPLIVLSVQIVTERQFADKYERRVE